MKWCDREMSSIYSKWDDIKDAKDIEEFLPCLYQEFERVGCVPIVF